MQRSFGFRSIIWRYVLLVRFACGFDTMYYVEGNDEVDIAKETVTCGLGDESFWRASQ